MSRHYDLKMALLGVWLLGGIFADGWAHNHIDVESFWTPWHAILYSGYVANAAFLASFLISARRSKQAWWRAAPAGYGGAFWGALVFGVSGVCDMIWHLIFGIEKSVSAAYSPPHLGIMVGTGLLVSGPLMAAWKRDSSPTRWIGWLPILLSLFLVMSLMTFVFQYADPLVVITASARPLKFSDQALGAVSILWHAAIMMGCILIAVKRWKLPIGSLTFVLTLNVAAMSLMRYKFFLIPAILLAAIGADWLVRKMSPSPRRRRQFHLFAFAVPVLYFACYFAAVWLHQGITWPIPLWSGCIFMAASISALISLLILPARVHGITTREYERAA